MSGPALVHDADDVTVGTVLGTAGINAGNGSITVTANHDVLSDATGSFTTNGGAITVTADADGLGPVGDRGTLDLDGDIAAGGGTVTFGWRTATGGSTGMWSRRGT